MNDFEHLDFEFYYGLSKQAAWQRLESLLNPVDLFRYEKDLRDPTDYVSVSQSSVLQQAFVAANSILQELNAPRDPFGTLRGA